MTSYAVIFRTHVWDEGVSRMAEQARACCGSGAFVVATDETQGELPVAGYTKLPHTSDFSGYGLPNTPANRVLWWNSDYVLYAARRALPDYDYYVMVEYDVWVNCDVDRIVAQCGENRVDFVAHQIHPIGPGEHWSYASASEMGGEIVWAFIPFVVVSGRGVDAMLRTRQSLAAALAENRVSQWPYCEAFMPTAAAQLPSSVSWRLDRFVDAELLQFRPFLSARDPRLREAEILAHPVMSGARFVKAFLSEQPPASHFMADGRLCAELQHEELEDLQAVLGDEVQTERNSDGTWSGVDRGVFSYHQEISRPWVDLAHGKPANQSSHSRWSHGATAEEDAALANRDPLPDDYAFHTGYEKEPWWQVDLLEICAIERIEIVNRIQCSVRFSRFRIDVSLDGVDWTACFTQSHEAAVSSQLEKPARITLKHQARARYLRITQLGTESLHLRRVRVRGFHLTPPIATSSPAPSFAQLLAEPDNRETLAAAVVSVVNQRIFGRGWDSYDIDKLAFLAAGVDSSQYAVTHMANARRFPDAGALQDHAVACAPESGMVLEFGVFSGKSINRIASQLPKRRIFGFDSFEGLPETWRPGFGQGAFKRVDLPAVAGNVELVVGWFDDTLPAFVAAERDEKLALLHVDCDLYSSTKTIFALLADRIAPGTVILFDEYFNYPEWRLHEYKAFQELVVERGIAYDYIGLVPSHQQVAVRVTRAA